MANSPQRTPQDDNPWRAAGLVMAIGAELAILIGLGWWLGVMYDDSNGTEYGYLTGFIVGLIAGIGSAVGLIRKYAGGKKL
ncbi:AtpZ/AtpI family protein [Cohnella abietis]|uniref:AtpZ/AtpI family protein n=1 Tax=Cohnella abietis TaxID=2507935 RepID=A0A3T1DDR0_9BACL|nr:AtpZ/AtpI family protein [Cohnella abietis]BBI36233.1 hypothetical protein KCTCHS21_56320 [Cohnella abietis]